MRAAALAALFALCACTEDISYGPYRRNDDGGLIHPIGGGGGGGSSDAGDAGTDGGPDAGDAGACAALTLAGVPAFDGCAGNVPATASGTVNTDNCTIEISLNTASTPCIGSVSGPNDAFDGGCQGAGFACTSSSLPGTLNCTFGTGICSIKICDAGAACP